MSKTRLNTVSLRSSAILTTSYVAADVIGGDVSQQHVVRGSNQLIILADFTIGSLTSLELKVETSIDGLSWYQESFGSISAGTDTVSLGEHTNTATGKYRIPIPVNEPYIRISAKGTGTVTSSLLQLDAIIGNV